MLKQKFVLMFSLIAIMATGAAYATAPSESESVGTAHTVYTAASNVGTATTTNVASGIAGVTYVNRMVNTAGNAAQKAEAHAAAAGAYAIQAENAAKAAQTTANNVANKLDKTSDVKKAIVTTDKDGKLAPVVISDTETGTYITDVTVSDTGAVTLTRGTPTAYSLPVATTTKLGGVKAGGANITIAEDGTISATDTKYSAGSNISLTGTTFSVPTANGTNLGVVKAGTNVSIANDGAVSVADATASTKGVAMLGVIPAGTDKLGTATIWVE